MSARQTDARNAVWTAINNWSALQFSGTSLFRRFYQFDGDDQPELNPTKDELPAIAIWPDPSRGDMVLNKTTEHPYPLAIMFWTATWKLDTAETYVEGILDALWQSIHPDQTVAEVKRVTGFWPMNEFRVDYYRTKLKNTKAILTILRVTLRLRFDPQS